MADGRYERSEDGKHWWVEPDGTRWPVTNPDTRLVDADWPKRTPDRLEDIREGESAGG